MREGYFVEHNGACWQSVFPKAESQKSQLHISVIDALNYMIQECNVRREQITVITRGDP